jgi:hypothetical protein
MLCNIMVTHCKVVMTRYNPQSDRRSTSARWSDDGGQATISGQLSMLMLQLIFWSLREELGIQRLLLQLCDDKCAISKS